MKYLYIICAFIVTCTVTTRAQMPSTDFSGYVSDMPYVMYQNYGDTSLTQYQNILHNRLNFSWYATNNLSLTLQMRNQVLWGQAVNNNFTPKGFETELYFLPLTYFGHFSGNSYLYSAIDRAYLQYTNGNFEATIGRQRINWGQTMVWNSNDVFNTYNFFDFDYIEKPGADAVRIQYYTGFTSSVEVAAKIDSAHNITAAALYRFNKWNYDIQLLCGILTYDMYNQYYQPETYQDIFLGIGWSGDFFGLSFRGELSYFQPTKNFNDTTGVFLTSLAWDYTLTNNMYVSLEFFYKQSDSLALNSFGDFYTGTKNAKNLSDFKYNMVGQVSYPVNPIVNLSLSGMYFFQDNFTGFYTGPGIDISTTNNTQLSAIYQFFAYKDEVITNNNWFNVHLAFLRFKWSF